MRTVNHSLIRGLDFGWEDIERAKKANRLLSFDLELSRRCNLRCIYCYARSGRKLAGELSVGELRSVIDQAVDLGAEKAVLIGGGEPLLHPGYWKILDHVRRRGLPSITFTNGTLITRDVALRLFDSGEDVAVKMNSLNPFVQDTLAGGVANTYQRIRQGIENLCVAGYSSADLTPRLAIETIICRSNITEILEIYRFCRSNGFIPYIEILTLQGNARDNAKDLEVSIEEGRKVFESLLEYDRREHGIEWPLVPPIVGQTCKRMYYSAYITSVGDVQPCPGVDISAGNLRVMRLNEILNVKNGIFQMVRNIGDHIKGRCKKCEYSVSHGCYGCRGTALHHTGDYRNSDPTCWWP